MNWDRKPKEGKVRKMRVVVSRRGLVPKFHKKSPRGAEQSQKIMISFLSQTFLEFIIQLMEI